MPRVGFHGTWLHAALNFASDKAPSHTNPPCRGTACPHGSCISLHAYIISATCVPPTPDTPLGLYVTSALLCQASPYPHPSHKGARKFFLHGLFPWLLTDRSSTESRSHPALAMSGRWVRAPKAPTSLPELAPAAASLPTRARARRMEHREKRWPRVSTSQGLE